MKPTRKGHSHHAAKGPSQRQLRAGELVRHALVDILRHEDLTDPALAETSITVTEVRMSPDFRHAIVFVEPLGAGLEKDAAKAEQVTVALNHAAKFLRGRLARAIDLRTIPDLKFVRDTSFDIAGAMDALFADPRVQRDLAHGDEDDDGPA